MVSMVAVWVVVMAGTKNYTILYSLMNHFASY